jgi:aminomethyltransferase
MTAPLSRTSALASRHKALGSGLEDWNGMGTAWNYDTDPCDEHDAVRERVGMFDMSRRSRRCSCAGLTLKPYSTT